MRLKEGLQPADFLDYVSACAGEVWMCSNEGDHLNLKSTLCKYLFITAMLEGSLLNPCWIECELEEDARTLSPYWEKTPSNT